MVNWSSALRLVAALASLLVVAAPAGYVLAQEQAAAQEEAAPEPLSEDELEILVARIALYPDELIAVISGASLYPLQIVEAARFLGDYEKNKTLKPKDSWDGSVISLLNYPEIVKMMSEDLDWTQQLGTALAYQQKDVLLAVQQLREEAVAKGVIKTDAKMEVTEENDNIVIKSASTETIYVPQYAPEMLYEPNYAPVPIAYYPDPYPHYYYPTAPFFAGFVTGAIWGAVVDWDDWGVWGGPWRGDIDIDCNHCFNNNDFNGRVNINNVDWRNVDRSKIKIDKNQFAKFDRTNIKKGVEANRDNALQKRATDIKKKERPQKLSGKGSASGDIRKSTLDGLKDKPQARKPTAAAKPKPQVGQAAKKPNVTRPSGKQKPAAKLDNRPKKPSGLGNPGGSGKISKVQSNRGQKSLGGGRGGGGGHKAIKRGGGRRR